MIREYNDSENVDLVELERQIRIEAIDECIRTVKRDYVLDSNTALEVSRILEKLKKKKAMNKCIYNEFVGCNFSDCNNCNNCEIYKVYQHGREAAFKEIYAELGKSPFTDEKVSLVRAYLYKELLKV